MKRSYWLFLLLFALAFSSSCEVTDKNEITILDDCDGDLLHARDSTTLSVTNKTWSTETQKAAGTCTSRIHVWFRWLSDSAAVWDDNPPPVPFEFSPYSSIDFITPQKFSGRPPGFGATSDAGWWTIGATPIPSSKIGNTTVYKILATDTVSTKPIRVYTEIEYRHSPN